MLDIQIKTTRENNPRWRMDIQLYNEISNYEEKIIEDIAIILEKWNSEVDKDNEENQNYPFN